jgi:hypothetical protein
LVPFDGERPVPVHIVVAIGELDELSLAREDARRARRVRAEQLALLPSVYLEKSLDRITEIPPRHGSPPSIGVSESFRGPERCARLAPCPARV